MPVRRFFVIGALISLVVSVSACDRIYALLQKEGAEEKQLVGEVLPFEKNVKVLEVQRLLKLFGYRVGKPDGKLGANTRNAIAQFQADNGLPVTRFVDKETWERLNIFSATGLVENGILNIKAVQQALKISGFDPGPVDGRMGTLSAEALKNFQMSRGLAPDGKIGFKTLRELSWQLGSEK